MAKTKKEKEKIVSELVEDFKKAKSLLFTNYYGLPVKEIRELRKILKEKDYKYKVVRKSLIKLSLEKAGFLDFDIKKIGSANGIVIGDDEIEPLRIIVKFMKERPVFQVESGLIENKFVTKGEIEAISKLPSKQELLAQVVFAIKSPLARLLNVCQYNSRNLVYVLASIKK
ncbi:50S ribosomal protein L10 [bacterium (Candidatus Moisslbacteria) CG12_big_fil_rev_8_21_14_0_65_36_11]|nr:50S ribosomal protein L10 [Candidatus Kuenenbacteria bacterium]OIP76227.1 MAG: 50S ribosomal protein L10 [Parcubacteria group bacterium CG2_30_36_38]PIV46237.1 MAG: 50S ribosomal protein L10 [bacterium (Candidatus Moisslbacteria) CG02_land_8_20_14_3_00_36_53]PIW67935.1 MAG: 50S ribosomal protein L10 [bacterium (Candidatus Moisslbacteria) CG12_big_fil_rev_8_21_14_0_65_36_11]PIZ90237.1 MAG: 50S ribosomal protein L10 [bacterium (Candidatus Moisslbacteria) CG_4_10_14_0_2_um_filter_36_61]PJC0079